MKVKWSVVAVAVVATVVGFLLQAPGPIGSMIWPMAESTPEPEGGALGLLMLMGFLEAVAFGVGVAFLVFGWNWVKRVTVGKSNAVLVYLATAWLLVNWVPHTALHMNHGNIMTPADFWGLVWIEYGFHLTLIIAGCIIASFVLRTLQTTTAMTSTEQKSAPWPKPKTTA